MALDWSGVLHRLRRLAAAPMPAEPVWCARSHRFALDPRLSATEVASAQRQFGVALPLEYREFLLQVGAGGAGPDYGLYPLRHSAHGWSWVGDEAIYTKLDKLDRPFAVEPAAPSGYEDLLDSEPAEDRFTSPEEFEEAYQQWESACLRMWREDPTRDFGAACLSTFGCGQRTWLVVSGPAAGQMWYDARIDDYEMEPCKSASGEILTFGTWYLRWLDKAEAVHLAGTTNPA